MNRSRVGYEGTPKSKNAVHGWAYFEVVGYGIWNDGPRYGLRGAVLREEQRKRAKLHAARLKLKRGKK